MTPVRKEGGRKPERKTEGWREVEGKAAVMKVAEQDASLILTNLVKERAWEGKIAAMLADGMYVG